MVALCELYRQRGFVGAEFEARQYIDQGEHFAVADLHWHIDRDRGQEPWNFSTTYNLVRTDPGWRVLLAQLAVAVAGVVAFKRKGTTVNPLDPGESTTVVRDGAYRYIRHPMYLRMLLVLAAVVLYLSNVVAALVTLPLFIWYMARFQIVPEERLLQRKFGEEYTEFLRAVRRWT